MLILAGVSLNAIIGDNGIINNATYASFLQEMTMVEEAVETWKTGKMIDNDGETTNKIPVTRMVTQAELTNSLRLTGEVGYYRLWNSTGIMPSQDIKLDVSSFDDAFSAEIIAYLAGIQDLYVLNNKMLELNSDKVYYIDAENSMIYSANGYMLSGIPVHSLDMLKALKNGVSKLPAFASAEVSGGGSSEGQVFAGNKEPEYLLNTDGSFKLDEDGNKIKNPKYSPYGFQIIADCSNNNVYKLYNNGDLYGKGIKGKLLGTSSDEMKKINDAVWTNFSIPDEIPGNNTNRKILPGYNSMFVIDSEGYLWGWGDNSYNKLGLSKEEQVEYIPVKATKLDVSGKKVKKVFSLDQNTFVLTQDNELYASGYNGSGQLGIGSVSANTEKFEKVNFSNPNDIVKISGNSYYQVGICILTETKVNETVETSIWYSGYVSSSKYTEKVDSENVSKFTKIYDGNLGTKVSNKIINVVYEGKEAEAGWILDENGLVYKIYPQSLYLNNVTIGETTGDVESIRNIGRALFITKIINNQRHFYYYDPDYSWGPHSVLDSDIESGTTNFVEFKSSITKNLNLNKVKDIFFMNDSEVYILMNDGKVYAKGGNKCFGNGISSGNTENEFKCIQDYTEDLPLIDSFVVNNEKTMYCDYSYGLLKGVDGKLYGIGNKDILFGEKKFQKNWSLIASNVKYFNASTKNNSLAYIDRNNDIWVIGDSASLLGCNTSGDDYELDKFVRLKDKLEGLPIYDNISGKVESYDFAESSFYIKTDSEDNNSLYVSGFCKSGTLITNIGVEEDSYIPTRILTNVEKYAFFSSGRLALVKEIVDGVDTKKVYVWGRANWYNIPFNSATPKYVDFPELSLDDAYLFMQAQMSIVSDNTNMYLIGNVAFSGSTIVVNGINNGLLNYIKMSIKSYLNTTEDLYFKKIVKNSGLGNNLYMMNDNSLYGLGDQSKLGVGESVQTYWKNPQKIDTPVEFDDVTGGSGFYIGVTKDGKVYATGSNANGILGRWIGIDRNSPNSRYKTAFEWVECPELEI